jgi:AraC family transcriptional activator of pobA
MNAAPLTEFYQEVTTCTGAELSTLLPSGIQQEVGHFNVFNLADRETNDSVSLPELLQD